jgi:hypothetical protein
MSASAVAAIYFGSFLAIGGAVKWAAWRWMGRGDLNIRDIQTDLEPRRGTRQMFLLGAWRKEGSDS